MADAITPTVATATPTATATTNPLGGANTVPNITSQESTVSNYAAPYVSDMLSKGQAIASTPYQAYTGQLVAGPSDLQNKAFSGIGALTMPGGFGTAQTGMQNIANNTFGSQQAQQYMNPYLQMSLNPQLEEARRASQITQMQNASKLAGQGAYGGGRQAIMDAETQRNLGTNLASITGQGYNTAYTNAMQQYNADQNRALQAQQGIGALATSQNQANLANLGAQSAAGATQQQLQQQADTAAKQQFEEERAYPQNQLKFQQSLLQGLPLTTQNYYTAPQTLFNSAIGGGGDTISLLKGLFPSWFNNSTASTTTPKP
jgi:hypothetical protein